MTLALRIALLVGVALLAGRAEAQHTPTDDERRHAVYQDSVRAHWDAEARFAAPFHVLTVLPQGDGFVFEADGADDDLLRVWAGGPLIVRTPGVGRAMVVVEGDGSVAGTADVNAIVIPPRASLGWLHTTAYARPFAVSYHRVRVLVCADERANDQCLEWTEASPRSGGTGLTLGILAPPNQPVGYDNTGGSGGGGRVRTGGNQ